MSSPCGVSLDLQRPGEGTPKAAAQNLEDPERRRIVAARLGEHAPLGHAEDEEAPGYRVVHQALEQRPASAGTFRLAVGLSRGESRRFFVEQVRRKDRVHEADALRLGRRDLTSGEHHVQGGLEAHESWEPGGAAPCRQDAQKDLGKAHGGPRGVGGHAMAARQRQLGPTAQTDAVNRRNRGDVQVFDRSENGLSHPRRVRALRRVLDSLDGRDVGAGDEPTLAGSEQEGTKSPLSSEITGLVHEVGETCHDRLGEDVHLPVRIVEGDPPDPVLADLEGGIRPSWLARAHVRAAPHFVRRLRVWLPRKLLNANPSAYAKAPEIVCDLRGLRYAGFDGLQIGPYRRVFPGQANLDGIPPRDGDGDVPIQLRIRELVAC